MAINPALLETARAGLRAQWLVATQRERVFVENAQDAIETPAVVNGVWHGTQMHICADGYCETATFGYGDDVRCARCEEFYDPARDDTL